MLSEPLEANWAPRASLQLYRHAERCRSCAERRRESISAPGHGVSAGVSTTACGNSRRNSRHVQRGTSVASSGLETARVSASVSSSQGGTEGWEACLTLPLLSFERLVAMVEAFAAFRSRKEPHDGTIEKLRTPLRQQLRQPS